MTDNVIPIGGITLNDIPVDDVLDGAKDAGLVTVVVIGRMAGGKLYVSSSNSDPAQAVYDFEKFKHQLFAGHYGEPIYRS